MSLQVGQEFAGYRILRVLGAGGMGTVYLATHPRLPRDDALKVLPAEFTGDAEYRARFTREADLAAGLSHPNIVGIQDRGEHDGQFWISMDYVAGTDLAQLLTDGYQVGLPVDQVAAIVTAVAAALDYAHYRGLLHRDVKPANILLSDADRQKRRIYLADFGIARRINDSAGLTGTNMAVGTVAYAAPEQLRGDPLDGRADQYALACTTFHLLTGSPPYTDPNPTVVITRHVSAPPPPIGARRAELAGLDPVFMRAMAKEPSGRFGSCSEFAALVSRFLTGDQSGTQPAFAINVAPQTFATLPIVQSPTGKKSRTSVLIGAVLGIALLIGGGIFAGVHLTRKPHAAAPATSSAPPTSMISPPPSPSTTANIPDGPGPFNGTYRADFGAATDLDGNPGNIAPFTGTYGLRSLCRSTGCIATAARMSRGDDLASSLVFDETDGHWVAVAAIPDQCRSKPTESWQMFTLTPGPDNTLTGELIRTTSNTCRDKRSLTMTRTGDLDVNTVTDPSTVPPRVVSPAEALHGHYHLERTFQRGIQGPPGDAAVTTACLRTGARCSSYFHGSSGDVPLIFANGIWSLNTEEDYPCPAGGTTHFSVTAHFPLPGPPQNPIQLLSGQGHQEQTGNCAVNTDFSQTITRTGD